MAGRAAKRRRARRAGVAGAAAAAALLLGGCTAGGDPEAPDPTAQAPATPPGSPAPGSPAPGSGAATGRDAAPPRTAAPESGIVRSREPARPPEAVATRNPDTGGSVAANQRNDIAKEPGEAAGLVDGAGRTVFRFTVTRAETTQSCPSRAGGTASPERAAFLVLDIEAELAAGVGASVAQDGPDGLFMPLVAEAFHTVGPDGDAARDATSAAAWSCFPDDELAPAVVNPGQRVAGRVVLDTAHPSGSVVYDPEGDGGWAWDY